MISSLTNQQVEVVAGLRLSVLRLARRIRQRADMGFTPSQLSAMSTIERLGPMPPHQLAARERVAKSTVTRLIRKLESHGWIAREPNPLDARSHVVTLTQEGEKLLRDFTERADAYLAQQFGMLTDEEQDRLAAATPVLERLLLIKS